MEILWRSPLISRSKVRVLDGPPMITGASRTLEAPADFRSAGLPRRPAKHGQFCGADQRMGETYRPGLPPVPSGRPTEMVITDTRSARRCASRSAAPSFASRSSRGLTHDRKFRCAHDGTVADSCGRCHPASHRDHRSPSLKREANPRRDRVGPICGEIYPERGGSVLPTPMTMTTAAAVGETERLRTVLEINNALIARASSLRFSIGAHRQRCPATTLRCSIDSPVCSRRREPALDS